jgi:hypothetical protein
MDEVPLREGGREVEGVCIREEGRRKRMLVIMMDEVWRGTEGNNEGKGGRKRGEGAEGGRREE